MDAPGARTTVRASATLIVGVLIGVCAVGVAAVALAFALGVEVGSDDDHVPLPGTERLAPDELGEVQVPNSP